MSGLLSDTTHCSCGGRYTEYPVTVEMRPFDVQDQMVAIRDVPRRQCETCGSRAYEAWVIRLLEDALAGRLSVGDLKVGSGHA